MITDSIDLQLTSSSCLPLTKLMTIGKSNPSPLGIWLLPSSLSSSSRHSVDKPTNDTGGSLFDVLLIMTSLNDVAAMRRLCSIRRMSLAFSPSEPIIAFSRTVVVVVCVQI